MPFTPAHAAAALPLLRTRLVPSALIVGTMAPDFEYFLRMAPGGGFGHTFAGAFLLSLPLALVILWMFHALVKAPLVRLFPDSVRQRIPAEPFRFGGPRRFVLIVISALAGIATHILWDSVTHSHMWPARHFPWLNQRLYIPHLGSVQHCSILQHASTVGGLALVAMWVFRWYRKTSPIRSDIPPGMPASRRWLILGSIVGVASAGATARVLVVWQIPWPRSEWTGIIGDGAATVIALAWWALVLYALTVRTPGPQAEA